MTTHNTRFGTRTTRLPIRQAAATLHAGGVIAYPTEAVYGLGCDPLNLDAVLRLLSIKRRDPAKGLILVADDIQRLLPFINVTAAQRQTLLQSWPGPHTWLVPVQDWVPEWLTGRHDTLAVRVSAHPLVTALCREAAMPIVSTSANLVGHPPARNALQARKNLAGQVDFFLAGRTSGQCKPTTIRDLKTGKVIRAS
jgi:L-threonylcarbamoyladenylate synthase